MGGILKFSDMGVIVPDMLAAITIGFFPRNPVGEACIRRSATRNKWAPQMSPNLINPPFLLRDYEGVRR